MRYLLPTLAALALLVAGALLTPPATTQSQASPTPTPIPLPTLDLAWEPGGLRVRWSSWEPGCLHLVGNKPTQRLGDIPCATAGDVVLPTGGVSDAYAPQLRTHVEVRKAADLRYVMAGRAIPAQYATIMPVVVQP